MPSTSKKQHNFMAAVAKNPSFAKKAGVKPSVGEDFLKADKGKKFGGGSLKAGVANPKTRHGKMKFFDKGGTTLAERESKYVDPTKLQDEADDRGDFEVNLDKEKTKRRTNLSEFGAAFAASRARGENEFKYRGDAKHKKGEYNTRLKEEGKKEEAPRRRPAAPAAKEEIPEVAVTAPRQAAPAPALRPAAPAPAAAAPIPAPIPAPRPPIPTRSVVGQAQTPRGPEAITQYNMPVQTPAQKAAEHARLVANEQSRMQRMQAAAAAPPKVPTGYTSQERTADFARMRDIQGRLDSQRATQARVDKPHDWIGSLAARQFLMSPEQRYQLAAENTYLRNKYNMVGQPEYAATQPQYAKGGSVESPNMTKKVAGYFAKKGDKSLAAHEYREAAGKEEDTPAIAKREMKALKGAPASMKSYESKEHKAMGMKCGGMAKYAKGGGVESKGKTKGKMIRMASGGMVGARADGCATRGKTKCKIR